ncbi:MAG: hypothetical protein K0R45_714 [Pseudomonas sp.]|nr:hypothetical protein [Pseudomonas sp.]
MKCVLQLILPIAIWLGGAASAWAQAPTLVFPPMTGSVVDAAQMLDSQTSMRLARLLRAHEQATGERVVVVTLTDLQGASIEEFGSQLGDAWNLGQQGKQDSALLIVDRDKRKVLIEVGSALASRLTDAQTSLIINVLIAPEFEDSRFSSGIERGAQAMLVALGGHVPDYPEPVSDASVYEPQTGGEHAWQTVLVLIGMVVLIVAISIRRGEPCAAARRGKQGGSNRFGGGGASGHW